MSDLALDVRSINKSFGTLKVLTDVSLAVSRGERRLILGPNGAGKTTLFNAISGVLPATSGSIRIDGRDVTGASAFDRARLGLGRTFQIITLFEADTLVQNVVLALLGRSPARRRFFGGRKLLAELRRQARAILGDLGLGQLAEMHVERCSYGEKRRLEIALALASQPQLLLLDEPFAGLSSAERDGVLDLLRRIPREVSIVMIEHDMDVALSLAERITVLHHGTVIADGSKEDVLADRRTQEVYLGR